MSLVVGVLVLRGGTTVVHAWTPSQAPRIERHLWDSAVDNALGYDAPPGQSAVTTDPPLPNNYAPSGEANQCPGTLDGNVKVDQGCLNISAANYQGRAQAHNETAIAANPLNPDQLLAASNDYKLGDGVDGGTEYSSDGGKSWQNSEVPLEFTAGSDFGSAFANNQCSALNPNPNPASRMYWQGGGDPSVAWDSRGNAYFAGLHFNRGSPPLGVSDNPDYSSGVYVYRSTANGGASWSFPGTAAVTCFQPVTPQATGTPLEDKPYMAIDDTTSSPFRDRIYLTWTLFAADGTAYIYEAHSSNYARSFSAPVLVSKNSSLCPNNYTAFGVTPESGNNCDENQFSQPIVGSDGSLYVAFANMNTTTATATTGDNKSQILLAKSTDGGATFGAPVQVGFYYDLPDCGTYQGGQDEFRACVPEQGTQQESVFRAANYPAGAADPQHAGRIEITYGSYINRDSNEKTGCSPAGTDQDVFTQLYSGVKTQA
ncbi:MAG: exo-alpha-sialidase, partial [Candidatus Dormibacteraeota bacterium]|nr:exo-alpha-sialidase [Candidatus Dormibacteraeota bacterium]